MEAISKRRDKWRRWQGKQGHRLAPQQAFADATGIDLIDAKCAVSFAEVCDRLCKDDRDAAIKALSERKGALRELVDEFVSALERALQSKVILQQVDSEIVADQEEYIRFFGRLGQGGTRLSDDELTYSIIKHQHPKVYDQMQKIIHGQAGRLAGEVDLVLAALRVAKTVAPWDNAKDEEVISRPGPDFVFQMKDRATVRSKFLEMINDEPGILAEALGDIRQALSYDESAHPNGLPAVCWPAYRANSSTC